MGYIFTTLGIYESDEGYDTIERAKFEYFKEQQFLINDRIRKSKENIIKNEKELEKLKNKYKDVIDKFPERMI